MSNIISHNFGGGGASGGGEPPGPKTFEEAMFLLGQQKEINQHLRTMLAAREEEYVKLQKVVGIAQDYLQELIKLAEANETVARKAASGFSDLLRSLPTRR